MQERLQDQVKLIFHYEGSKFGSYAHAQYQDILQVQEEPYVTSNFVHAKHGSDEPLPFGRLTTAHENQESQNQIQDRGKPSDMDSYQLL